MTERYYIGGSDAAAACGLDPWKSRVGLWLEKTGQVQPFEPGEAAEWGKALEPLILDRIAQETGGEIVQHEPPSPELPYLRGCPDAYIATKRGRVVGVVEAKTAGLRMAHLWDDGVMPIQYVLQVQHYLAITRLDFGIVGVLIGGQHFETRRVERDQKLIETMLDLEVEFWGYVERVECPPPDGSDAASDAIRAVFPTPVEGEVAVLDAEDAALVREYRAARDAVAAAEKEQERIKQEIQLRMGAAERLLLDGVQVATWKAIERRALDLDRLKKENRKVYDQYLKTASHRRFVLP